MNNVCAKGVKFAEDDGSNGDVPPHPALSLEGEGEKRVSV